MNRSDYISGRSGKEVWPESGEDWMMNCCKTRTGKVKVVTGTCGELRISIKYEAHDFPLYFDPNYFLSNFKKKP